MKKIILLLMSSTFIAMGDDVVCERIPDAQSGMHPGHATGSNGVSVPVVIQIYGEDSIAAAEKFGRALADENLPVALAARYLKAQAEKLYRGQEAMIRWFEADGSFSYDYERFLLNKR